MAANAADYFKKASNGVRPVPTTLSAIHSTGGTTLTCVALTGWATTTGVSFCVYTTDTNGNKVAGTQTDWSGVVSGSTITNIVLKGGTDQNYSIGAVVEAAPIAGWADDIATGALVQHNQDGTHAVVTATSVAASGALTAGTSITAATAVLGGTSWANATAGWIAGSGTWTYASATTFTVPSDDIAAMTVGTKIRLTQTTSKYFYVTGVSGTTVTVTGGTDYTVANAAITAPFWSNQSSPVGFPAWFAYTATWTGYSSTPTYVSRFKIEGRNCFISHTPVSSLVSNSTALTFTLPVTPETRASATWLVYTVGADNSAPAFGTVLVSSGSATATAGKNAAFSGGWTNVNNKWLDIHMWYGV